MGDRKPVNLGVQEMEVSPNDSENSEDSVPENPSPLGSQALPPIGQGTSENQDLPPEMSAGPSSSADAPVSNQQHQGSSMQDFEDSDSSSPKANPAGRLSDSGVSEARRSAHERTLGESNSIGSSSRRQPIRSDIENLERISDIQENLLTILGEIGDAFAPEGVELQFVDVFESFSAKPITLKTTQELSIELRRVLKEWRKKWAEFPWGYLKRPAEAFALFIRVVVQTLVSTVLVKWSRSRLNLYSIMFNYENFKRCRDGRFSVLQNCIIGSVAADDSNGKRVSLVTLEAMKQLIATYSLPMQNALSELLKCVESVDADIVYQFEIFLLDDDKSFLYEHYPRPDIL